MAETIQVQQRFPAPLLGAIDAHADKMGITRTGLVNMICQSFMEAIEIDKLRAENEALRKKVVEIAMAARESRGNVPAVAHGWDVPNNPL